MLTAPRAGPRGTQFPGRLRPTSLLLLLALLALLASAALAEPTPPTELQPGVPVSDDIDAQQYMYYKVALPSPLTADVSFTVTPIGSGDPDLYCSLTNQNPSKDSYDKRAIGFGEDTIVFTPEDIPDGLEQVYCAVYGWTATSFTIVAQIDSRFIELVDGQPQSGLVDEDAVSFYKFQVADDSSDVTFSATPIRGSLKVFISNSETLPDPSDPATYKWISQPFHGGESIVVFPTDHNWPAAGTFTLAVLGLEDDSPFSLVASTNETNTLLRDGMPQQHVVQPNSLAFYKTRVNSDNCKLTVTVTPLSGDPDLYMAREIQHPRPGHYEKHSYGLGGDSITYEETERGMYYIGVHAYSSSSAFTIVSQLSGCHSDQNETQWLLPGVPQHGRLDRHESDYYMMNVRGQDVEVSFSLTRNFGDPDIYVTTDGTRPSLTNYQFLGVNWGEDLLVIRPTDQFYCTDCNYWAMIWASSNTSYTLTGSTEKAIITLREGVPLQKSVGADEYVYFRFQMTNWGKTLTFSVMDLARGNPDIFVSTTNPRPDLDDHMWSSQSEDDDSVTIPASDPDYCSLCTYYMSVRGKGGPSTFTALAGYEDLVRLVDSVPQTGQVAKGAMRFYALEVSGDRVQLTFSLSVQGTANMFINTCENPADGFANCIMPDPEDDQTYHWSATGVLGSKAVRILANDEFACAVNCVYVVGVEGVRASSFQVVGRTAGSTTPLRNGVSLRSALSSSNDWEYFSYRVDQPSHDLALVVTPISGDPDMYVSLSLTRPNTTHYDRASVRYGEDIIDFPGANVSMYWIGVMAYTPCTFSIMAIETSNSGDDRQDIIPLVDGEPQSGTVHMSRYQYYSFQITGEVRDLTITVTQNFGDPDLYVHNDGTLPTKTNYRWKSANANGDLVRIDAPEEGEYLIGVYGYTTASFVVTAATGITQLQNGVTIRGRLDTSQYRYYRFVVDSPDKDLTVTVTPFSGDPDIYMSRESQLDGGLPTMDNYEWAAQSFLGDSITVPHTDEKFEVGAYIIGVYSYLACGYGIVATVDNAVRLQDASPQAGSVARHAFRYYSLLAPPGHKTLTVSVTPITGNPNLYVTTGPVGDTDLPTLDYFDRKADGWYSGQQIIFREHEEDFCHFDDCVYWIGVYGEEAANFSVIATTNRKSIALRDGIPVREHVETDSYSYFVFDVDSPGNDVIISVTAFSGDPDIYADDTHRYPNASNAKWVSRGSGSDALSIPNAEIGSYYIGVYGFENATFSITAMTWSEENNRPRLLLDGVPQRGAVPADQWAYYLMHVWTDISPGDPVRFSSLRFALSVNVGDPDLYVTDDGTLPTLDNYKWRSDRWGDDSVEIRNPADATYTVGVRGFTASTFTMLGATKRASRMLMAGVPFSESLETDEFEYFEFTVSSLDMDLSVVVTAFEGDPDLFMSAIHKRPNATHSEWKGQGYLEDSITVPSDQLKLQTYYISVYAYSNTTYTIVANLNSAVTLRNGVPQLGSLPARESATYFQFTVPKDYPDLSVYLSPLDGNFFLFVSHTQKPEYGKPDTYQWASYDSTGLQQIVMRRGDEKFCDDCKDFYIMVYSVSRGPSSFNVVASTTVNGLITLIDGIPQRRTVQTDEWEYYKFRLSNTKAAMIFSVTPISGDPDMYISTVTNRPSAENNTWSSTGWGADVINIDYTDPDYITGDYFVGISAFETSTFTISVQVVDLHDTNSTSDVLLLNGLPQVGFLEMSGQDRYFRFPVPAVQDGDPAPEITITASPRYGDPDLFVYVGSDPRATPDNAQWISRSWGRDSVTILPDDDHYCTDCVYKITVRAYTRTLFTISASRGPTIRMLEMGVPFRDDVRTNEYRYFQFLVNRPEHPFVLAATVLSSEHQLGDPDMFISHESSGNHYPNSTHHDWAENHFGSDIFSLPTPETGYYYVSIRGYRSTTYTLTGWNGPVTLLPGEPQKGVVTADASALFIMSVDSAKDDKGNLEFTLVLDDVGSNDVSMWVCNNCINPGPDNFQWTNKNSSQVGIRNQIVIPPTDPRACDTCLYFLRVEGTSKTAFTLNGGYSKDLRTLVSGRSVLVTAQKDEYRYFRTAVDARQQDVFIDATLFVGEIVVIASFTIMQPNKDSDPDQIWISDQVTGGAIHLLLDHNDPRFHSDALLFISVFSADESRFSIGVTTGHMQLTDGQPTLAVVPAKQEGLPYHGAQFFFRNDMTGRRPSDIAISLTARPAQQSEVSVVGSDSMLAASSAVLYDTPFEVYVTTSESDITNPGPGNYTWHRRVSDLQSLVLPSDHSDFCTSCNYYIAVFGEENAQFSMRVTTADSYVLLLDGEKDHSAVRSDRYRYFEMYVAQAQNFSIYAEPCVGSVAMYASQDNYRPTRNRFRWKSDTPSAIQEISNADEGISDSSFYIAVLGRQDSEFIIHGHTRPLPKINPIPGDTGALATVTNTANAVQLNFRAAQPVEGSSAESLNYRIYQRRLQGQNPEQEGVVMYSLCGLKRAHLTGTMQSSSKGMLSFTVKNLEPRVYYTFNVVVEDPSTGGVALYEDTRGVQTLSNDDLGGGVDTSVIFGVAVPVLLIIGLVFAYLCYRNRKLSKAALDIQMNDVPDHAVRKAVRDPAEAGGAKKYHQLLADEAFGADDLNYSPPVVGTGSSLNDSAAPVKV